ncbi:MAG: PH domain-containing protein [Lactobacillales bacterium]|nr:PH domain-containing protein [Lactobacillales bacterium]
MKDNNGVEEVEFQVKWEGQPAGLWQRFLSLIKLNFTYYQITKDELIIKTGFFKQKVNTIELYLLKDPDMTVSLYQRLLKIGTVSVLVDSNCSSCRAGQHVLLKNIKDCDKVRKLLRDSIEADVMERKITYFDKV